MKRLAALLGGMVLGLMLVVPVQAADKQLDLVKRLGAITRPLVGKIGFAAQVLGEKEIISLNGDDPFPMASAYKVAMAAKALKRIQDGELSLNQMVEVPPQRYVFSDIIATNFIHPGLSLSIANLMEVMITHSDNTATDMVLELAGGPVQVTRWLKDNGIEGIRVDRPTEGLMRDFYGLESGLANMGQAIALNRDKPDVVAAPKLAFEADALDKASPKAMLRFLVMLADGDLLDK